MTDVTNFLKDLPMQEQAKSTLTANLQEAIERDVIITYILHDSELMGLALAAHQPQNVSELVYAGMDIDYLKRFTDTDYTYNTLGLGAWSSGKYNMFTAGRNRKIDTNTSTWRH